MEKNSTLGRVAPNIDLVLNKIKVIFLLIFAILIVPSCSKLCSENTDYFCVAAQDCEPMYLDANFTCNDTEVCCKRAGKRCWSLDTPNFPTLSTTSTSHTESIKTTATKRFKIKLKPRTPRRKFAHRQHSKKARRLLKKRDRTIRRKRTKSRPKSEVPLETSAYTTYYSIDELINTTNVAEVSLNRTNTMETLVSSSNVEEERTKDTTNAAEASVKMEKAEEIVMNSRDIMESSMTRDNVEETVINRKNTVESSVIREDAETTVMNSKATMETSIFRVYAEENVMDSPNMVEALRGETNTFEESASRTSTEALKMNTIKAGETTTDNTDAEDVSMDKPSTQKTSMETVSEPEKSLNKANRKKITMNTTNKVEATINRANSVEATMDTIMNATDSEDSPWSTYDSTRGTSVDEESRFSTPEGKNSDMTESTTATKATRRTRRRRQYTERTEADTSGTIASNERTTDTETEETDEYYYTQESMDRSTMKVLPVTSERFNGSPKVDTTTTKENGALVGETVTSNSTTFRPPSPASSKSHVAAQARTYFEQLLGDKTSSIPDEELTTLTDTSTKTDTPIEAKDTEEDSVIQTVRLVFNTKKYWERLPTKKHLRAFEMNEAANEDGVAIGNFTSSEDDFQWVRVPKEIKNFWEIIPNQIESELRGRRDSFVIPVEVRKSTTSPDDNFTESSNTLLASDWSTIQRSDSPTPEEFELEPAMNPWVGGRLKSKRVLRSSTRNIPFLRTFNRSLQRRHHIKGSHSKDNSSTFNYSISQHLANGDTAHESTSSDNAVVHLSLNQTDLDFSFPVDIETIPQIFNESYAKDNNNNTDTDAQLYRRWIITRMKVVKRKRCNIAAFHTVKHVHIRVNMPCTFPLPVVDREFHRKSTVVYMRNDSESPFDCLSCKVEKRRPKPGCTFKAKVAPPNIDVKSFDVPSEFAIFERPNNSASWSMFICKERTSKLTTPRGNDTLPPEEVFYSVPNEPGEYVPTIFHFISIQRKQSVMKSKGMKLQKREADFELDLIDLNRTVADSNLSLFDNAILGPLEAVQIVENLTVSNDVPLSPTTHVPKRANLSLILSNQLVKKPKKSGHGGQSGMGMILMSGADDDEEEDHFRVDTSTDRTEMSRVSTPGVKEDGGQRSEFRTYRLWLTQLTRRWMHDPITTETTRNDEENKIL